MQGMREEHKWNHLPHMFMDLSQVTNVSLSHLGILISILYNNLKLLIINLVV